MYLYFTAANTLKYLDVLPDLVRGYNASYHRSIRQAPQDVTPRHEKDVWKTLYGPRRTVHASPNSTWGTEYGSVKRDLPSKKPQWTEEVFEVRRVVVESIGPVFYKLKELDGTPVQGTFYEQELQKLHVDDDTVWWIKKVLKRLGDRLYVQWKGWPKKYNSWIRKQDLA